MKAVPDVKSPAFKFKLAGTELPFSGVADAANNASEINIAQPLEDTGVTLKMDFRIVDQKVWVKIAYAGKKAAGLPTFPKKWMFLDPAKLKDKSWFEPQDDSDPGSARVLVENAADVKQTSPGHFAGTTDLTKATDAEILDEAALKALGAAATKVPFDAVVDEAGHLTSAVVKIPAAGKTKAHNYTVSYTAFGSTPKLAAPAAGEQQKATAGTYEMLNG
ncbi:hypothetical protein [Paractinoplanes ferrugineus]|uniref:hypothetical protein n=1 Tax=Paractinoplanes ferrugineus TaxID=113564 RepID=UPI001943011D|nr:hypothetical protein [Actinoplanes ferrugineus]